MHSFFCERSKETSCVRYIGLFCHPNRSLLSETWVSFVRCTRLFVRGQKRPLLSGRWGLKRDLCLLRGVSKETPFDKRDLCFLRGVSKETPFDERDLCFLRGVSKETPFDERDLCFLRGVSKETPFFVRGLFCHVPVCPWLTRQLLSCIGLFYVGKRDLYIFMSPLPLWTYIYSSLLPV